VTKGTRERRRGADGMRPHTTTSMTWSLGIFWVVL
jgi:hypothetical protein